MKEISCREFEDIVYNTIKDWAKANKCITSFGDIYLNNIDLEKVVHCIYKKVEMSFNRGIKMLTLNQLKKMKPGLIFATGTANDEPDGLFMANTNKKLRWVAVRGGIHDWAIYCHFADKSEEWIARQGDKVHDEKHIKMLVPCNDKAFKMYRD